MLIEILATLKSGAAYVPMDPSYPDERISHILEDTKAKVILANEIYQDRLRNIIANNLFNAAINQDVISADTSVWDEGIHLQQTTCEICSIDSIEFEVEFKRYLSMER